MEQGAAIQTQNVVELMPDSEEQDSTAKFWIAEQVQAEVDRIKAAGSKVLPMSVSNYALVIDYTRPKQPKAINRVEVQTGYDFNKISQIMVSDPIEYPHRDGYRYVNALLFTDKPLPMLVPYLYNSELTAGPDAGGDASTPAARKKPIRVKNNLQDWLFINSKGERCRHRIDTYYDV
ncbi:hypothetical protein RI367_003902 [Sorochytrium milnesiophthora]